jgi:hypothetical protein
MYRQSLAGEWTDVLARVREDVETLSRGQELKAGPMG